METMEHPKAVLLLRQLRGLVGMGRAAIDKLGPRCRTTALVQENVEKFRALILRLPGSTIPDHRQLTVIHKKMILDSCLEALSNDPDPDPRNLSLVAFEACAHHFSNYIHEYAIQLGTGLATLLNSLAEEEDSTHQLPRTSLPENNMMVAATLAAIKIALGAAEYDGKTQLVISLQTSVGSCLSQCVLLYGLSSLLLSRLCQLLTQCPALLPATHHGYESLNNNLITAIARLPSTNVETIEHMTNIGSLIYAIWDKCLLQQILDNLKTIYATIANTSPQDHLSPALAHLLTLVPPIIVQTLSPHIPHMPSCNSAQNFKNTLSHLSSWLVRWPAARETLLLWLRTLVSVTVRNNMTNVIEDVVRDVVTKFTAAMRMPAIRDCLLDATHLLLLSCQTSDRAYLACFDSLCRWGQILNCEDLEKNKVAHQRLAILCHALMALFPHCSKQNSTLAQAIAGFPEPSSEEISNLVQQYDWKELEAACNSSSSSNSSNISSGGDSSGLRRPVMIMHGYEGSAGSASSAALKLGNLAMDSRADSATVSATASGGMQETCYVPTQEELPDDSVQPRASLPAGLDNIGSTCYYNAIMQALFATDAFRHPLLLRGEAESAAHHDLQTLYSLLLFTELESLEPTKQMVKNATPEYFEPGSQNDASEFMGHLLDFLKESEMKLTKEKFQEAKEKARRKCEQLHQQLPPVRSDDTPGHLIKPTSLSELRTDSGSEDTDSCCTSTIHHHQLSSSLSNADQSYPAADSQAWTSAQVQATDDHTRVACEQQSSSSIEFSAVDISDLAGSSAGPSVLAMASGCDQAEQLLPTSASGTDISIAAMEVVNSSDKSLDVVLERPLKRKGCSVLEEKNDSQKNPRDDVDFLRNDESALDGATLTTTPGDASSDDNSDSGISIQDDVANSNLDTASTVGGVTEEEDMEEETNDQQDSYGTEEETRKKDEEEVVTSEMEHDGLHHENVSLSPTLEDDQIETLVQNTFGGKTVRLTQCLNCKTISECFDNSLDLKVFFEVSSEKSSGPVPVDDLINYTLKKQELTGSEQYFCNVCQGKQNAEIHTAIVKAPEFLILTQNRFIFNNDTHQESKILTRVNFEETLDLPVWELQDLKQQITAAAAASAVKVSTEESNRLLSSSGLSSIPSEDQSCYYMTSDSGTSSVEMHDFCQAVVGTSLRDRTEKLSINRLPKVLTSTVSPCGPYSPSRDSSESDLSTSNISDNTLTEVSSSTLCCENIEKWSPSDRRSSANSPDGHHFDCSHGSIRENTALSGYETPPPTPEKPSFPPNCDNLNMKSLLRQDMKSLTNVGSSESLQSRSYAIADSSTRDVDRESGKFKVDKMSEAMNINVNLLNGQHDNSPNKCMKHQSTPNVLKEKLKNGAWIDSEQDTVSNFTTSSGSVSSNESCFRSTLRDVVGNGELSNGQLCVSLNDEVSATDDSSNKDIRESSRLVSSLLTEKDGRETSGRSWSLEQSSYAIARNSSLDCRGVNSTDVSDDVNELSTPAAVETAAGHSERYALYAIVVHSGKISRAGHYYCYTRSSSEAVKATLADEAGHPFTKCCDWVELNDNKAYGTSFRALKASLTRSAADCAPYLMFYQKVSGVAGGAALPPTRLEEQFSDLPAHLQQLVRCHLHHHRRRAGSSSSGVKRNEEGGASGGQGGGASRGGGAGGGGATGCGGETVTNVVTRYIY